MNRKEKVTFAPEGIKNKRRLPGYVALIVAAAVFFGAASFVAILAANDFDIKKALGARQEESTAENSSDEAQTAAGIALQDFSGSVNFLFICKDKKSLTFCNIISASPSENKIKIKPVAADFSVGGTTLGDMLETKSAKEICSAFSEKSIPVSRYVTVSEENFVRLLQALGKVDIVLDSDYNFSVDAVKYTFSTGAQSISADYVLKLMKYAASGEARLKLQAQVSAAVIRTHFTSQNFSRGEDFFSSLINLVDTDITAFDYTNSLGVIETMLAGSTQISTVG